MLENDPGLLVDEALAWICKRAVLEPSPIKAKPEEKWLIRSALQKAVRRGQQTRAMALALDLHRIDPSSVWRAVRTIAVEDVGPANPDVVFWSTEARRTAFRRQVGETPLLIALVREMAAGRKSRAAVELSFVTSTSEPEVFRWYCAQSRAQLLSAIQSTEPVEVYAALSVLRGVTPRGLCNRDPDPHGVEMALDILRSRTEPCLWRGLAAAVRHPLDEMSLGFAAIGPFIPALETADVRADLLAPSKLIGGYPAEAYDQHERSGRRALSLFASRLANPSFSMADLSWAAFRSGVLDAVFVEEGQCLDRWVCNPKLADLRDVADRFSLTRHGLSVDEADELRRAVRDGLEELHSIREIVARDA